MTDARLQLINQLKIAGVGHALIMAIAEAVRTQQAVTRAAVSGLGTDEPAAYGDDSSEWVITSVTVLDRLVEVIGYEMAYWFTPPRRLGASLVQLHPAPEHDLADYDFWWEIGRAQVREASQVERLVFAANWRLVVDGALTF